MPPGPANDAVPNAPRTAGWPAVGRVIGHELAVRVGEEDVPYVNRRPVLLGFDPVLDLRKEVLVVELLVQLGDLVFRDELLVPGFGFRSIDLERLLRSPADVFGIAKHELLPEDLNRPERPQKLFDLRRSGLRSHQPD